MFGKAGTAQLETCRYHYQDPGASPTVGSCSSTHLLPPATLPPLSAASEGKEAFEGGPMGPAFQRSSGRPGELESCALGHSGTCPPNRHSRQGAVLSQLYLCRSPALCSDMPRQGCLVWAGSCALLPPARAAGHHAHAGWPTRQLVPSLVGGGGSHLSPYSRSVEGLGLHPWFRSFPC